MGVPARPTRAQLPAGDDSTLKKIPDLLPILPNNKIRAQMPAPPQQFQFHARSPRKFLNRPIRNVRIVVRMKHHHLRRSNFRRVISGVIKLPTAQLLPIPIR